MNRAQGIGRVRATAEMGKEVSDNTAEGVSGFGGERESVCIRRVEFVVSDSFFRRIESTNDTIEGRGV